MASDTVRNMWWEKADTQLSKIEFEFEFKQGWFLMRLMDNSIKIYHPTANCTSKQSPTDIKSRLSHQMYDAIVWS